MENCNDASIADAVAIYGNLGLEPIPLEPNSKQPLLKKWQTQSIVHQWKNTGDNLNIGLRCGGINNFAVFDCDNKNNPETFTNITSILTGLGINPSSLPIIQTGSKVGRHIYLCFENKINGNYTLLNPKYGTGELRFGNGSYVIAPPSTYKDSRYQLIDGEISNIPVIRFSDIRELIIPTYIEPKNKIIIPRNAYKLLISGDKGGFPSFSEKEQSIITSIINRAKNDGLEISFEDIREIFDKYYPDKYSRKISERGDSAKKYLSYCFEKAKLFTQKDSEMCNKAKDAIVWAENQAWPGRTGSSDRAVYIAHAEIVLRKGSMPYHASVRDLALIANVGTNTASHATKRLIEKGLISFDKSSIGTLAKTYFLANIDTLPKNQSVRECIKLESHDTFKRGALNKSGFEVWSCLHEKPMTIKEIADRTGRGISTVINALTKMSAIKSLFTGEIISIVEMKESKYYLQDVNLDDVAKAFGTFGLGKKKAIQFQKERAKHKVDMEINKLK